MRPRRAMLRRSLLASLLVAAAAPGPLVSQTLTITNTTVVDVSNGALRRASTVVVEGNRIASVLPSSRSAAPRGRVVDGTGLFVIPGLWDMHTHAYFGWPQDLGDDWILPLFIANGITGIRDMGSDLDAILRARREVQAHRLVGPRLVVSGPMLDGPQVAYPASIAIKTPDDGRAAVDSLKRRGVDFIKIQSGVPHDAYLAVAAEARKLGIPFEGHVPDAVRASEAAEAGQRSFEHLIGIFEASTPDEDAFLKRKYGAGRDSSLNKFLGTFLARYDAARESQLVSVLAKRGVWQCPTLFWERGQWLVDTVSYTKDPDIAYTPRSWLEKRYPEMQKGIAEALGADPLEVRGRWVDHELGLVRRLRLAGVPFLAGTDTPAGVDVTPGISLHLELQRFIAAGFTPLQALQTATINPARFLGRTSEFGAVAPGRTADLVLLRANPLDDIANTRAIAGVVADGRYWSAEDLAALRDRIKQGAARR